MLSSQLTLCFGMDGSVGLRGHGLMERRSTALQLNPMIRALRENDIEVTAIHSHMLDEQPRVFFVHFWPTTRWLSWQKAYKQRSRRSPSRRAKL